MNWISLLYPQPHFDINYGPQWWRKMHTVALTIAYYIAQTVALIGLSIVYVLVIVPMKTWALVRGDDLLEQKFPGHQNSYLKKSEDLSNMNFERMF